MLIAFKILTMIAFAIATLYGMGGKEETEKKYGLWISAVSGVLFIAAETVSRILS